MSKRETIGSKKDMKQCVRYDLFLNPYKDALELEPRKREH